MKISTKLTLGYLLAAGLVAVVGLVGLQGIVTTSCQFDELLKSTSQEITTLEKVSAMFFKMQMETTSCIAVLEHQHGFPEEKMKLETDDEASDGQASPQMFGEERDEFNEANRAAQQFIQEYRGFTPQFNASVADSLEKVRQKQVYFFNQMMEIAAKQQDGKLATLLDSLEADEDLHRARIAWAIKRETQFADDKSHETQEVVSRSKWLIIFMGSLATVLAIFIGNRLARNINRPLVVLTRATERLGQGDYFSKVQIRQTDELGTLALAFNKMVDELGHAQILERQKRQLERLNSELKKKNDALDSFVYRVSHDLKAPIINISSLFKLLKTRLPNDPDAFQNQTFGFIDQSVKRLHETVHDLLEVSRIERNTKAKAENVLISTVFSEVEASLSEVIRNVDAHIETDFDEAPTLFFPRPNLQSIFANLLSNSLKYRALDRRPKIKIETTCSEDFTRLTFKDNGIGMDLVNHGDKLFEMFSRLHSHADGTGVGLYIVKKLIEDSGGRIEVQSKVGIGTTFSLYFIPSNQRVYAEN